MIGADIATLMAAALFTPRSRAWRPSRPLLSPSRTLDIPTVNMAVRYDSAVAISFDRLAANWRLADKVGQGQRPLLTASPWEAVGQEAFQSLF